MNLLTKKFDLTIDYSRSLQEMISAGNYGWVNNDITKKHFPLLTEFNNKKVKILFKLFTFNHSISSENVISKMNKAGYRPATLVELLALGEFYPELQKEFSVVALNSLWRVSRNFYFVPVLGFGDDGRVLDLDWLDSDWHKLSCFLAVCR